MIKLRTTQKELKKGPEFAQAHDFGLRASTDAAVAHALLKAMGMQTDPDHRALIESIYADAQMVLRTDYGIDHEH